MEIDTKELLDLTRRISGGKVLQSDIEMYREACKAIPGLAWENGVLTSLQRDAAIRKLEADSLIKESIKANIQQLEREMGAANAKGAERILIENVITSWFSLQMAENKAEAALDGNYTLRVKEFYGRRLDAAHSRFSRAVSSLAQFRKVNIQIQINIAQQQVVAGTLHSDR